MIITVALLYIVLKGVYILNSSIYYIMPLHLLLINNIISTPESDNWLLQMMMNMDVVLELDPHDEAAMVSLQVYMSI